MSANIKTYVEIVDEWVNFSYVLRKNSVSVAATVIYGVVNTDQRGMVAARVYHEVHRRAESEQGRNLSLMMDFIFDTTRRKKHDRSYNEGVVSSSRSYEEELWKIS